jgi:hypothetical protein
MSKEDKVIIMSLIFTVLMFVALLLWSYSVMAADLVITWDASTGPVSGYKLQLCDNATIINGVPTKIKWRETRDTRGTATTYTWTGASDTVCSLLRAVAYNDQGEAVSYTRGAWFCPTLTPPGNPGGVGLQ